MRLKKGQAVRKRAMNVTERLRARHARLAPFCLVDPVKQHLRLQSYYQLARQLYRQSEAYFTECAFDNAYVFLAKFIRLCSKVTTAHHDYELPQYHKDREWVRKQAEAGFKLFDEILDGMEAEENEYLEYEKSLNNDQVSSIEDADKSLDVVDNSALEKQLQAMRLTKKSFERSNEHALGVQKNSSQTVSYPTVGKASWMTVGATAPTIKPFPAPPRSRQRSQKLIANLTCGKTRSLELPASIIAQFILLASLNTNQPPYGIETCGILAGILRDQKLVITTLIIPKQEVRL